MSFVVNHSNSHFDSHGLYRVVVGLFDNAVRRLPCRGIGTVTRIRVWTCTEALGALRQAVAKAGDNPSEVALHSSRIGSFTTLAAEGEVPQRVTQT